MTLTEMILVWTVLASAAVAVFAILATANRRRDRAFDRRGSSARARRRS